MAKKKKKKENKFYNILDYLKESALFLLFSSTLVLIITNLLFILKISITSFHLPIIYILSIILFIIYRKKENYKKNSISIIIATIVFIISILSVGRIYDSTADGNTYHKLAVGALKNGWNPLYDHNEAIKSWSLHYPKFIWIYGANLYSTFGNESVVAVALQTGYAITGFAAPTSAILMLGLSTLDIKLKDYYKFIWKFLIALFVISLIILYILLYL